MLATIFLSLKHQLRAQYRTLQGQHWVFLFIQMALLAVAIRLWRWHTPAPGTAVALLAVTAAAMSIHAEMYGWQKSIWMVIIGVFLLAELKAIRFDRESSESTQAAVREEERRSFRSIFDEQRDGNRALLDSENGNFRNILQEQEKQFGKTLGKFASVESAEHKALASENEAFREVVSKEEELRTSQRDVSEQLTGRLVPGTDITPSNACDRYAPIDVGSVTTIFGSNASVTKSFPHSVLVVGGHTVIGVDRVNGSDNLSLALDFRDEQGRVLLRLNKDGAVNRSRLILLHPSKNTFLVQDEYGKEFLKAEFVNPNAFRLSGNAIYCGKVLPIGLRQLNNFCSRNGNMDIFISSPSCSN